MSNTFYLILAAAIFILVRCAYLTGYSRCWQRDQPIIERSNAQIRSMREAMRLPEATPGPLSTPKGFQF